MADTKRIEQEIAKQWQTSRPMVWNEGEWWSSERFFALVEQNRKALAASGFSEGQRLAVLMGNCPAFFALCIACWQMGGTVVPLNALAGVQSVASSVLHASPAAVVMSPALKAHEEEFRKLGLPLLFLASGGALEAFEARRQEPSSKDIAFLFYTSGTTGNPKAVMLSHQNILRDIDEALATVLDRWDDQVMLNVLPNFHTLGCIISGVLPMVKGIPQALRAAFLPVTETMKTLDEAGATLVIVVPTLLHFLTSAAAKEGWKPRTLKMAVCGGDRLSPELSRRAEEFLGVSVVEGYGLTECSPVLAVNRADHQPVPGSVGPLLPSVEYELHDLDGAKISGDEGVLWVKGPTVSSGYFDDSLNTKERFSDGWFNTGDMVRIDENRYVTILERVSDLIIVGGFNVYPQEVEQVLNAHPAVKESAVVGLRQSVTGQMIRAFVILKEGEALSSAALVDWCRERLPHYKVPRRVEFVSDFPRNAMGKVLRRKLREKISDQD